ncbi:hypothetical protein, partial [Dialister succinatiphilus]|uniref:hypothetical protein n=1 Tax=Dialister succinatiphilus TaxID=487173 RepID=UPI003AF1DFA2
ISPQVHCTRTIGGSLARIQTKKQVALTCVLGGSEERIGWLTWCVLFKAQAAGIITVMNLISDDPLCFDALQIKQ